MSRVYRIMPGDPYVTVEWKDEALGVDWTPWTSTEDPRIGSKPKTFHSRAKGKQLIDGLIAEAKVRSENRDGGIEYYP